MNPFYKTTNILIILASLVACTKSSNSKDKNILVAGLLFLQSRTTTTGIGGPTATRVYGQGGSFTTATSNKGGISTDSLYSPEGIAIDSSGGIYIGDTNNNRVLYYPAGSTTATKVYGQNGSFTANTPPTGSGITASSLSGPTNILLDSNGGVYISNGQRVLYFTSGSTTASRVYGQAGSFTINISNQSGTDANSLYNPSGLALDSSNGLYIADSGNNRVLYYPSGTTTATRVYGQLGSFTNSLVDSRNVTADSLNNPRGLLLDKNNGLYIADSSNNRVLYFTSGSIVPSKVYGQSDYTSSSAKTTSASSLGSPYGLVMDSSGGLYISNSNRVTYFPSGNTVANKVYGQGGNFTTSTSNNGGISANSLNGTAGLALDASERLYIVDTTNNRVLYY